MTATAHALVAGAIASSVSNPALGISLSLISHPLLDMIPHWDAAFGWRLKTKKRLFLESSADFMIGVGLSYLIFGQYINFWYFLACVLVSLGPDLVEIPYWFFKWNFPPFSWVYQFQHHIQGRAKLPWGILTQVVMIGAIILMLQSFKV